MNRCEMSIGLSERGVAIAIAPKQPAPPSTHPDDMPDQYALKGVGVCMIPFVADGAPLVCD